MGDNKQVILTYEGVKKIEEELEYLKTVKRKEVSQKIKTAISFGDLSENSEYDEAKNEQAFVEGRIATLENMLKNAKIIDEDEINTEVVSIGSTVKVKDLKYGDELEFTIVGSAEADPAKMKISNEAPIGRGLLGKKVGDKVEIQVPDGVESFEILEIKRH
ncbi:MULTISPECIES: transcription elongation factor GreA [Caloramator]|jgi:transcription elongation factor GreA|uniref:Transcription elongation factor GreA n=1 Tax=Caloramator australicus RC3 TaxID=857293 RepID=I7LKA7_9CLOT|nr:MULTISPECIES: transcription elongation factor GreA [Caloramator]MCX7903688.1 transcription elongation factor GreA [Caloramator sp.]MDO6354193.1 transcription elongation factor GreA [Caloramator sp. CAR-1]CCJ34313.1 Transcription elongation factor GreA [Caloramator australicus RC3]